MRQSHFKGLSLLILILFLSTQLFAQDAQSLILLGESYAQKKMWKQAQESLQKAVAVQPQNSRAHNDLGYVYQATGYYREALQEYEIALKLKPDNQEALQNLLSGASEWSQDLIDHGQSSTAVEILNEAIKRAPDAGELYYFLGVAYWSIGKTNDALAQWKKAAAIKPSSSIAHVVKALESFVGNDIAGAIKGLNAAIQVLPSNAFAHNILGIIYAQTGKLEDARKEFEEAIKHKPNYAEAYTNIAVLCEKAGQMEEAIKYYKTATIKNPYSYKGLSQMATMYFKMGRYFDAESCFRRAIRIHPLSSQIHSALAFTLDKQNKRDEAIQEFEAAINIDQQNIDALVGLGIIIMNMGNKEKAAELFNRAIQVNPNHALIKIAQQKLAEIGGSPTPVATGTAPVEATNIVCESPDGDLAISISPKWQDVPIEGEGGDKFLWIMAQPERGVTLTVYKPQKVPVNNLGMIKDYAVKDAEKKGCKKENETPIKISGQDGYRVQFTDSAGSFRYLFITVKDKKAFILITDMKDNSLLSEAEEIINGITIK